MMTYSEALEKLHDYSRFGSRLGLDRMRKLMALLGDPQDLVRVIHVAGTNGKGSVCRYIYSILLAGGYKAGLYTSPFLERFTERIELAGAEITESDVACYAEKVFQAADAMIASGFEPPTEFEIITAMAFCYYADQKADFVVLEVGLGGRGDSTNIVKKPEVSVITSISFDHMDYLGESLAEIAAEKAGIIKKGIPVVAFIKDAAAKAVIRSVAADQNSSWHDAAGYLILDYRESLSKASFDTQIEEQYYKAMEIAMIGLHQAENAICALATIKILEDKKAITLSGQQVYNGLRQARQTGRLEILAEEPYIIIDGAHNEAGAAALAEVIRTHFKGKRVLLVLGMLKDKKTDRILDALLQLAEDIIVTEPDNPRRMTAEELGAAIRARHRACVIQPGIAEAVDYAMTNKDRYDAVVFAGSLYLIGKVRSMIHETT